jgi:hypothetical protein
METIIKDVDDLQSHYEMLKKMDHTCLIWCFDNPPCIKGFCQKIRCIGKASGRNIIFRQNPNVYDVDDKTPKGRVWQLYDKLRSNRHYCTKIDPFEHTILWCGNEASCLSDCCSDDSKRVCMYDGNNHCKKINN